MDYLKYFNAFIDEANENVHALNRCLLELEQTSGNPVLLNSLFRSAHTLKASSQSMGFLRMAKLTHEMEDVVLDVQKGRITLNRHIFDLLFRIIDCFESLLFHICEFGSEGSSGADELLEEMAALRGKPFSGYEDAADNPAGMITAVANGDAAGKITEIRPAFPIDTHTTAGDAVHMQQKPAISAPPYGEYKRQAPRGAFGDKRPAYEIKIVLVRDCLMKAARAYIIIQALEKQGEIIRIEPDMEAIEDERFDFEFSVALLSGVGLKMLQRVISGQSEIDNFTVTEIETAAGSEAAPLSDIFDRFPKIFAELTKKLGKQAELVINGGDTLCDAGILSGLRQSLLHILRNSVDHGVETPETRLAIGKAAKGRVAINAFSNGEELVIEVADDGAGVDLGMVREKAVKAGIISEFEAGVISKESILNLIFQPMLSTREYVSMYSGRGIGMDVVKAKTEELGGAVEIVSEEGRGTKIILRLPYAVKRQTQAAI